VRRLQELALDLEGGLRPRDVERLRRVMTALRVGGSLNQKVLVGRLGVSQATTGRVVARLEELGLVERRRGEGKELVLHLI
jgi:DNA-binding MarR family transcriptional regulator